VNLLDRYVLRSFLVPFIYCFLGFLAIWFIFDLSDNATDFIEGRASPARIGYFYATQFPQIAIVSLPVGLLLALLYSLSRMSRSNEIIAMLTAGRSIARLLVPIILVGLCATAVSTALNYKLAPGSERLKRELLDQLRRAKDQDSSVSGQLFRNRSAHRTWYVQRMSRKTKVLDGVHVTQQDGNGSIITKYYARRAAYDPERRVWNLERGKTVHFKPDGDIASEDVWLDGSLQLTGWPETPWRIASSSLDAQSLSVPELREYLAYNADFPEAQLAPYRTHLQYRWALPWTCFVVVFIAAPLGIVFSRRGVLAGVAWSIFIFFGMVFLTNLFLALGKGARVPPVVAAWAPNAFFAVIGLLLIYFRSTNREVPKFAFGKAR
jgi:lipopolysaccharide export system permease protein